jgi:hypothetical protein
MWRRAAMATGYRTRPIKRPRRTQAAIRELRDLLLEVVREDQPMTVRQVFYRLVSLGAIPKSEAEYKGTVCRLLADLRLEGAMPFEWIADNTRWMRKPRTYSSLEEALWITAQAYRRDLWESMDAYVEIWLEKDALAGVLYEETTAWDVPLMVTRGYPSLSYLHVAAESIRYTRKPTWIYYFGDYDPSGQDIPRNVEDRLRKFAPDAEIYFELVAVTPEQILRFNLPTRPTKLSDTRSKGFIGESVELDAIPPAVLREMVSENITRHIDSDDLDFEREVERHERESAKKLIPLLQHHVSEFKALHLAAGQNGGADG